MTELKMYSIKIKFGDDQDPVELQCIQPGQTLLEVCLHHQIKIPHECGGICFCRTCHIYVEKGNDFLERASKRESDFITHIPNRQKNSRLACQCLLLAGKGQLEISLPKS
jgi:ferredoxin, 2Fe-2S